MRAVQKSSSRKISAASEKSKTAKDKSKAVQNGRIKQATPKSSAKQQKKSTKKQSSSKLSKSSKAPVMNKKTIKPIANGLIHAVAKPIQPSRAAPKKPPKFSYVVEGVLAGMGRPTQHGHMQFLCDNGFKYLVTLTLNKPRAILEYPGEGLEWVHIPIQDETPPSVEQITKFVTLVDKAKDEKTSVAVHCAWGRGRTGTMLACYLAKAGRLSVDAAVQEIRRLRPGSIDTEKQMDSLRKYVQSIGGR